MSDKKRQWIPNPNGAPKLSYKTVSVCMSIKESTNDILKSCKKTHKIPKGRLVDLAVKYLPELLERENEK